MKSKALVQGLLRKIKIKLFLLTENSFTPPEPIEGWFDRLTTSGLINTVRPELVEG
jgi:hypothetical protein